MDFVGGALPNVMLIAGLIAIGLGLGIEFKIVEIKGDLSRTGRIGAIVAGMLLIGGSVYLYTLPSQTATTSTAAPVAALPTAGPMVVTAAPAPTAEPALATAAPAPTAEAATAAPVPTAAPTATTAPPVQVPDIRGRNTKDAQKALEQTGLKLVASDSDCATLGATRKEGKLKKDQIVCQWPDPSTSVPANSTVVYVIERD